MRSSRSQHLHTLGLGFPWETGQRLQQRRHSGLGRQGQTAAIGAIPLQQPCSGDTHLPERFRQGSVHPAGIHRKAQPGIIAQGELQPGIAAALPAAQCQSPWSQIEAAAVPELPTHPAAQAEAQLQKARLCPMPGVKSIGHIPFQAHLSPVAEAHLLHTASAAALRQGLMTAAAVRLAHLPDTSWQIPKIFGDDLLGPQVHGCSSSPGQERAASCSMV